MSTTVLDIYYADASICSFPVPVQGSHRRGNGDKEGREKSRMLHRVMRSVEEDTWVSLSNPGTFVAVLNDMLSQSASSVAVSLPPIRTVEFEAGQTPPPTENARAIALLDKWLADTSGYDHEVWPETKSAIEENRSSYRKRFDG
jgi:hypothetical protein